MTTYRVLRASDDVIAAPGQTVTYDPTSDTWVPTAPDSGTSVTLGAPVATADDLPATGTVGEGRIAQDTGHLWQWDGSTWVDMGEVRGPKGDPGEGATDEAVAQFITEGTQTPDALASVIDARTGTGKRPVGRDELVVNARDYPTIEAALAAAVSPFGVAAGVKVVELDGVHERSAALTLTTGQRLRGRPGATIRLTADVTGRVVDLRSGATLENVTIDPAGFTVNSAAVSFVANAAGATVRGLNIVNAGSVGVRFAAGTTDCTVTDCRISGATNGIHLIAAKRAEVTGNRITAWSTRGIWVQDHATSGGCEDLVLRNNWITGLVPNGTLPRQPLAIQVANSQIHRNFEIVGNVCLGRDEPHEVSGEAGMISLVGVHGFRIIGNVMREGGEDGITIMNGCRDGVIVGNIIDRMDGPGIHLRDDGGFTVTGNVITNCCQNRDGIQPGVGPQSGIHAWGCKDAIITGNIIRDDQAVPTMRWGIAYTDTPRTRISGNQITGMIEAKVWKSDLDTGGSSMTFGETVEAVKTTDTTRSNTDTRSDDPHLNLPVDIGATYMVEALLLYSATATAGFAVSVPTAAGSTVTWSPGDGSVQTGSTAATLTGAGAATTRAVRLTGSVTVGTTPGNLRIGWAQGTAEASDVKLLAGSWLRLTRVA